jgi:hypothetical protein
MALCQCPQFMRPRIARKGNAQPESVSAVYSMAGLELITWLRKFRNSQTRNVSSAQWSHSNWLLTRINTDHDECVFWDVARVALVGTDVTEERIVSIIRVTRMGKLGTLAVTSNRSTLPRNRNVSSPSSGDKNR